MPFLVQVKVVAGVTSITYTRHRLSRTMAAKQVSLLRKNTHEASPDAMKKVLGKVTRSLTALAKATKVDPGQAFSARNKAVAALRDLDTRLDGWIRDLDTEQAAHARQREAALERRREDLRRSAEAVGWKVLRRGDYDIVDCFRVDYKKDRVTVRLGSERLDAFDEVDGKGLLSRLRAAREALDRVPFDRLQFLQDLKGAIGVAGVLGRDRNGKVPIRKLYPFVALIRQTGNARFLKRPDSKTYADYPMTQFVYDFARFGRQGWKTERGERISNQPPNMADVAKGASVTLPVLGGQDTDGVQLGSIQIERSPSA